MKKITTFLILLIVNFGFIQAQTIQYYYDVNGNQTSRYHTSSTAANDEGSANPDQLLAQVISIIDQNSQENQNLENEKEASIQISVYPNPATDKITLSREIIADNNNESVIILLDAKGQILDKLVAKETTVSFDINHLAKGMYYVYYLADGDEDCEGVISFLSACFV